MRYSIAPLFVVSSLTLLAACSKAPEESQPIRPVLTQVVQPVGIGSPDIYPGELRARFETDLAFRIGGKILKRLAEPGMRVKRGQALALLDPQDAHLAADAARAQVAAAESDLAFAKAELDRNADLLARNFISKAVFDNKQNAFSAAKARLDQARAQASINLNQAGYTTLTADSDGLVTSVTAETGQVVAAGQVVVRLAKDGEREVWISVPESKLEHVKAGKDAVITFWAQPGSRYTGKVREVNNAADAVTRTYAVKVTVSELPPNTQLGMTANVVVANGFGAANIVVPLAAITKTVDASAQPAVWVVDRATRRVQLRPVKVAAFGEQGATIAAGLAPGDTIVTAGVHKLLPNQEVRLTDAGPTAPASTLSAPPATKAS